MYECCSSKGRFDTEEVTGRLVSYMVVDESIDPVLWK